MERNRAFEDMFQADLKALSMGLKLRKLIYAFFLEIEETIVGGAKVKLALYSRGGKNNVLCGIQRAQNNDCILYVHHIQQLIHDRLKLTGKGKHAKQIRFSDVEDIREDDIWWLLGLINDKAPFAGHMWSMPIQPHWMNTLIRLLFPVRLAPNLGVKALPHYVD